MKGAQQAKSTDEPADIIMPVMPNLLAAPDFLLLILV